jgi:hypothetical protein
VTWEPAPGTIGLVRMGRPTGGIIRCLQWLDGSGFEDYEHAVLYLGNGQIIEAMPGGARICPVEEYAGQEILWCTAIAKATEKYLSRAVEIAHGFEGVGYSFLDYLELVAARLHVPSPQLKAAIASTGHMICSQLCVRALDLAGAVLFPDRWRGLVDPGDVLKLEMRLRRAGSPVS